MRRLIALRSALAPLGAAILGTALLLSMGAPVASAASVNAASVSGRPHYMATLKHVSKHFCFYGFCFGSNNLTYHGGPVETAPHVYMVFWGAQWANGFSTGGYSSATAQTYIQDFFANVGGSSWDNINSQYCQGIANGATSCPSSAAHIQNISGQFNPSTDSWMDTVDAVPSSPTQAQIAAEADAAEAHFGYSANATYFVFTPTGHSMSGFGTQWCAWHDSTGSNGGTIAYAYIPYMPDAGSSCGENFVNTSNDAFGNGYFDGFSIVAGHEYAEALTDAHPEGSTYAWYDSSGNEIGDKCAWSSASNNISLGGHSFAVQPLWSNANSGCVMSH